MISNAVTVTPKEVRYERNANVLKTANANITI